MVLSIHGATPIAGWFIKEHPTKMDDLGVLLFQETSKWTQKLWIMVGYKFLGSVCYLYSSIIIMLGMSWESSLINTLIHYERFSNSVLTLLEWHRASGRLTWQRNIQRRYLWMMSFWICHRCLMVMDGYGLLLEVTEVDQFRVLQQ